MTDIDEQAPPQYVGTPTGATIKSSAAALLPTQNLPLEARKAHVYPGLRYKSLISVGQMCDAGYAAVFTADKAIIVKKEQVTVQGPTTMEGHRNEQSDHLWTTTLSNNVNNDNKPQSTLAAHANSVYALRTIPDIIKYHHQSLWSPTTLTWTQAIDRGHFLTFPGLTSQAVRKHLQPSVATAKGHMKKTRQHLRSTTQAKNPQTMTEMQPITEPSITRSNTATFKTIDVEEETGRVATDQTGRFPIRSSRGHQYLMVVHIRDPNIILAIPLKNRSQVSLMAAYADLYDNIKNKGFDPKLHICDNECPQAFKGFLKFREVDLQKAPPYDHRTNPAEKAIDTFKSHFIAGLASLPPDFPLHLWDRLIPHAVLALNLLRRSNTHPHLSAYAHWEGVYDYNAHPMAPPGCKVVVYETVDRRESWGEKGVLGWYLGPSFDHYRCHKVFIPRTNGERVGNSVKFFPHNCAAPQRDPRDEATRAALLLTEALQQAQQKVPYSAPTAEQMSALSQLSEIFSQATKPHDPGSNSITNRVHPVQQPRVSNKNKEVSESTTSIQERVQQPRVLPPTPTKHLPETPIPTPRPVAIPFEPHELGEPSTRYNLRPRLPRACAVLNKDTGKLEEYTALANGPNKDVWIRGYANDLGRLAQGVGNRISGTNTVFFISHKDIPAGRKVTYGKKEVSIRPNKTEMYRVRLTVGGDKLVFDGDTATQCASLTTTKILFNSVLSTPGARFGVIDIKNMYYGTPMSTYEYMRIRYSEIPEEIKSQYNLQHLEHNGWIYLEIRKGMPGLKQAGKIANERLTNHLARYGYRPTARTPSLWKHDSKPIAFTLVVDDFGVKYVGRENFDHLCDTLRDLYEITVDLSGSSYLGMTLDWDYKKRHVDISVPGYVEKALQRFQHVATRKKHAPFPAPRMKYGTQYTPAPDNSPALPQSAKKHVQQVVGTFLYYALTIDLTMLVALGSLAAQQNNPTEKTMSELTWFLDYCAAHPDAKIRYHKSDMTLWVVSDASYLSEDKARSRTGGLFFLSDRVETPGTPPTKLPTSNGIIACNAKILKNIMSSAMEAEVAAAYENAKEACPMRQTLEELGHKQPPTPLQVDNAAAVGFANGTTKPRRSKAIDMRFHWVADRVRQGQFVVYWAPGNKNWADYVTKHHPASHHLLMRPTFFESHHWANLIFSQALQGCDRAPKIPLDRGKGGAAILDSAENMWPVKLHEAVTAPVTVM